MEGNGVGVLLGRHSTTTINGKKYGLGAIDFDGTDSDLTFDRDGDGDPTNDIGDGDPTNDDTDGDGIPNYLDPDDTASRDD